MFKSVDRYVRLLRYERLGEEMLMRGFRVNDCEWLIGNRSTTPVTANSSIGNTEINGKNSGGGGTRRELSDGTAGDVTTTTAGKSKGTPSQHVQRTRMVRCWLVWLFDVIITPTIRAHFYVTETGSHRNRVFYFRQPLWKQLQLLGEATWRSKLYVAVNEHEASQLLRAGTLGFSYLRMLPKPTSMRFIVNMSRRPPKHEAQTAGAANMTSMQSGLSINQQLANLFQILTFEKCRQPDRMGGSVFGMDDVYQRLQPFVKQLRQQGSSTSQASSTETLSSRLSAYSAAPEAAARNNGLSPLPPLYIVSVDIKDCFDSVKHEKLFDIVAKTLMEDEYLVRRFSSVIAVGDRIKRSFARHVEAAGNFEQFVDFARSTLAAATGVRRNTLLTDQVVYHYEERDKLLELLREHIFRNLVSVGGKLYKQGEGIAQGSVLSTLLCSFFYGDLETEALKLPEESKNSLLMRLVDDFLMVTTDRSVAMGFLRTMHHGVQDYGCRINATKTKTNFNPRRAAVNQAPLPTVLQGSAAAPSSASEVENTIPNTTYSSVEDPTSTIGSADSVGCSDDDGGAGAGGIVLDAHLLLPTEAIQTWMPWCGILINTRTLETRVDIMRYSGGFVNETVTLELSAQPGTSLKNKLGFFMRVKCHPLLYDPAINTCLRVGINIFHIFMITAFKFHINVKALPPNRRVQANPPFFFELIASLGGEFVKYAHLKSKSLPQGDVFNLTHADVLYLSLSAFIIALAPKQTIYTSILPALKTKKMETKKKLSADKVSVWELVLTSEENAVFRSILY